MRCRHCAAQLKHPFLDLGFAPPSNAYLNESDLRSPELHFPLRILVCNKCWLVQTEDYAEASELFDNDYAYFSSVSKIWLDHAAEYFKSVKKLLSLNQKSHVIEVASNDGYLLKNFVADEIPCLGIEPTASTALAAEKLGVPVLRKFFGAELANQLVAEGKSADLVVGNNVFAHVPDINDFTEGLKTILKHDGVVTLEFPHLLELIEHSQFDTVYHEHFSYLSLTAVSSIFKEQGLRIWDVEQLATHGGSLRIYGCHNESDRKESPRVNEILQRESLKGLNDLATYSQFQSRAEVVKDDLISFLLEKKRSGKRVAAYGAAAKGNTMLNYAGIGPDLLSYVCDAAPSKQGKFLPGSHIPIEPPEVLKDRKPDYILILPWNIALEVIETNSFVREWGGKFVTAVPSLKVL